MNVIWKIEQLERTVPDGGVVSAHWRATGTDGDFIATNYGSVSFNPDPTSPDFMPFENLTEADVLRWVWKQLDKAEIEAGLAAQIDAQKSPKQVTGLPW